MDASLRHYIDEGKRTDYIKMPDLLDGYLYRIHARNSNLGIWSASDNGFIISRVKFNLNYLFVEFHYDFSEHFGTVKPFTVIEKAPFVLDEIDINNDAALLNYLNERGRDNGNGTL